MFWLSIAATLLFLYFLPVVVAVARRHRSAALIFVLTIFVGWTGVGWLILLVWSLTGNTTLGQHVVVTINNSAHIQGVTNHGDNRAPPLGAPSQAPPMRISPRPEAESANPARPPLALEASSTLERHISREGRPYYRNEISHGAKGYLLLKGPAFFEISVAGSSHYQTELDAIAGGRRDAPVYLRADALVCAEPNNKYDANAVAVYIGTARIGYIRREDAPAFGAELAALGGPGAFSCRALIENGWPDWYVKLDAFRPLELWGGAHAWDAPALRRG